MSYKPNDPYYAEFCTQRFDTGAATNADALPVATANHNGTDDAGFVLTVTNIDAGRYKVTGTIPNTYAKGDVVSVSVAATVNSVAGKGIVDSFVLDSKRVGDLQDPTVGAIAAGVMGDITDTVGADVVAIKAQTDKLAFDASDNVKSTPQTAVTVGANNDKTGYSLAAGGLDAISIADPGAPANVTTLPRMVVVLWRRFFKKSTLTATQLDTYADDGTTVNSTQAVSDDGTTQTQGAAV